MQLLIHYGIYKTGSSYIQTICIRNRAYLEAAGIYFPESKYDERMLAGEISPGNSSGLTNILRNFDEDSCRKIVEKWLKAAKQRNCDKILISDEALIHVFAIKESLLLLNRTLKNSGINNVSCFAFFRNPVDHCISTFKHRAKRGTIPDFEGWVKNTYETMRVIDSFIKTYNAADFHWKFNAYQKSGKELLECFFSDWLGIKTPENTTFVSVNPSLSISELKFIQIVRDKDVRLVPYVYNVLVKLPKSAKANDSVAEKKYRTIATMELLKQKRILDELNSLLPKENQLFIDNTGMLDASDTRIDLVFSYLQAKGIIDAMNQSARFRNIFIDFVKGLKRSLFNTRSN